MRKIFICIGAISWLLLGCAQFHSSEEIVYEDGKLQKFAYSNDSQKSDSAGFMDALDVLRRADPAALPQLADLPRFQRDSKDVRRPPIRGSSKIAPDMTFPCPR